VRGNDMYEVCVWVSCVYERLWVRVACMRCVCEFVCVWVCVCVSACYMYEV